MISIILMLPLIKHCHMKVPIGRSRDGMAARKHFTSTRSAQKRVLGACGSCNATHSSSNSRIETRKSSLSSATSSITSRAPGKTHVLDRTGVRAYGAATQERTVAPSEGPQEEGRPVAVGAGSSPYHRVVRVGTTHLHRMIVWSCLPARLS